MRLQLEHLLVIAVISSPIAVKAQAVAILTGKVIRADGNTPVGGARISAVPEKIIPGMRLSQWSAVTAADGTYRIEGLTTGAHRVCVQAPNHLLDPCRWNPAVTVLQAGSNQLTVALRQGARVSVVAVDRLGDTRGAIRGGHSPVTVMWQVPGQRDRLVPLSSWTDSAFEYSLLVPEKSPGKVRVTSARFYLAGGPGDAPAFSVERELNSPVRAEAKIRGQWGPRRNPSTAVEVFIRGRRPGL